MEHSECLGRRVDDKFCESRSVVYESEKCVRYGPRGIDPGGGVGWVILHDENCCEAVQRRGISGAGLVDFLIQR